MAKKKLILAACFFVLCTTTAYAADGYYMGGMAGAAFLSDSTVSSPGNTFDAEFDTGYNLSLMAGYKYMNTRLEGEIGYQRNDLNQFTGGINAGAEGDADMWRFMVNGYYDIENDSPWTPYFDVGLGYALVSFNEWRTEGGIAVGDDDDWVFAYQAGAGIAYTLNETAKVFLDYRFFGTQDPDFSGGEAEIASHNISLGVNYAF